MIETIGHVRVNPTDEWAFAECEECGASAQFWPARAQSAWDGSVLERAREWAERHPDRCAAR